MRVLTDGGLQLRRMNLVSEQGTFVKPSNKTTSAATAIVPMPGSRACLSAPGCAPRSTPMSALPAYKTIMADPPWPYHSPRAVVGNGGRGAAGADRIIQADVGDHYDVMSMDDIRRLPVAKLADRDAHLYLWTTNSFMEEAYSVARAWGFRPKTILTWAKTKKDGSGSPSMKTGYWYRSATEHALFCVRGKLRLRTTAGLPTWFAHERLPHSVKPEAFRGLVEKASPGPYLELFARRAAPGWDAWGNQAPNNIRMP